MIVEPIAFEDSGANPVRRTWQTPQVITGTMDQAEFNVGLTDDDDGGATPDNS